jgi:hypothetical protein
MASSADVSKKALEDIKALLGQLNDDHAWDLVNAIRDTCSVIIPVWFTPTLVKEITEDDLEVSLSDAQTSRLIDRVNENDSGYSIGRNLVVNLIHHHFEVDEDDNDSEDDDSVGDEDNDEDEDEVILFIGKDNEMSIKKGFNEGLQELQQRTEVSNLLT